MTDRQLRSMGKTQLLEILRQQEIEIQKLTGENEELTLRLEGRLVALEQAGSIAEASIMLSGVMQAAQDAADIYLENIRTFEAARISAAERLENEAREKADDMIRRAALRCAELELQEKLLMDKLQSIFRMHADQLVKTHSDLHEMINRANVALPRLNEPEEL